MKSAKKPLLSIIIVYFGEYESLKGLLASIKKNNPGIPYEIVIVNNKVGEKNLYKLKKSNYLKIIESGGDLGYGNGNNLGAEYAKGKYFFIINPDTLIKKGTINTLVNFLDNNPEAAIVAPNFRTPDGKLIFENGSRTLTPIRAIFALTILNRIFPKNPVSSYYFMRDKSIKKLREADVVSGTAFLIRKTVYKELGGFDKNFFLYFEESDLGKRIKEKGRKIYINPEAEIIHDWHPQEKTPDSKYYKKSRFYYFNKHYGILWALIVELFARLSKISMIIIFAVLIAVLWLMLR